MQLTFDQVLGVGFASLSFAENTFDLPVSRTVLADQARYVVWLRLQFRFLPAICRFGLEGSTPLLRSVSNSYGNGNREFSPSMQCCNGHIPDRTVFRWVSEPAAFDGAN